MQRNEAQQGTERHDNQRQDHKARQRAKSRRPPAAHSGDRQHDGERLDRLDQRGQEGRGDRRAEMQVTEHTILSQRPAAVERQNSELSRPVISLDDAFRR